MNDEPLIWTSKGNLPVSDLEYKVEWKVFDGHVEMHETYTNKDGEVVKNNLHACYLKGMDVFPATQTLS